MTEQLKQDIRKVINDAILTNMKPEDITDTLPLAGDSLDSMAVMRLILALEEYFGFVFDEDELSAESFENLETLTALVEIKLDNTHE